MLNDDIVVSRLGKPTSGRYVYKGRNDPGWYWQCDLHEEFYESACGGPLDSMAAAWDEALLHAYKCGRVNLRTPPEVT